MVRIFCLTSITRISAESSVSSSIEILPYDDINERLWHSEKEEINHALYDLITDKTGRRLTCNVFSKPPYPYPKEPHEIPPDHEPSNLEDYKLTEICKGWKCFSGEKVFVMYLFRDDTDLIKIKMVRGSVKFVENKLFPLKDAFDLIIATSKSYDNFRLVKNFDIQVKVRCNIDCKKLPSKIESLSLENNDLKTFDPEKSLPQLNSLRLGNNKIENITWENLQSTLDTLDIQSNNLTSIGNISHIPKVRVIIANRNKISTLCLARNNWNSHFQHLYEIDLGTNELSNLPIGFESLGRLTILKLDNNKFDYNNGNIKEKLWDRLPTNLQDLNLNFNNLHELPCYINCLKLNKLEVVGCKLTKICSLIIDPEISFQNIHTIALRDNVNGKTTNLIDLINVSTYKIKYDFKEFEDGQQKAPLACKCCVRCGVETNEKFVKQLFLMDLNMVLESENGVKKEYPKNKWRSNSIIRLCKNCLIAVKEIAISDEFKAALQIKTVSIIPSKKRNKKPISSSILTFTKIQRQGEKSTTLLSNVPFYTLQLNQFCELQQNSSNQRNTITYPNKIVPNSNVEMSDTTCETLPSIDQIYSNRHQQYTEYTEYNNISYINDYDNISQHDQQANCLSRQQLIPVIDADNFGNFKHNMPITVNNDVEMNYIFTPSSNNVLYNSFDNDNFDPSIL